MPSAARVRELIGLAFAQLGFPQAAIDFALQVAQGESSFIADRVGDNGLSIGIFQLHEQGLQPAFFQAGFTDLNDPWQQAQFVASYIAQNQDWSPWTVARNLIASGVSPGVGVNPFGGQQFETPEAQRQGQLEADLEFLREQHRLAQISGDREAQQRLSREIELLERQLAFQRSEGALGREFEAEQAGLNRELQLRLQRLSDANALTQTLAGLQEQARNLIVETMGRDPFRGAVLAQGGFAPRVTPLSAFREELEGFESADIPRATGGESLEDLQGIIEEQRGLIEGQPQPPIGLTGLAHGGVIDMERDGSVFKVKPRNKPAFDAPAGAGVLVGEAGREVVRRNANGQIEIIPLVANAQQGVTLGGLRGLTGESTDIGAATGLLPLFEAVGITGELPIGVRGVGGFGGFQSPFFGSGIGLPTAAPGRAAETFQALGTRPRLLFIPELGTFFSVDPSGETQAIGDAHRARQLGFDPENAVSVTRDEAKQLGSFPNIEQPFEQQAAAFQPRTGQFGALQPIFLPFEVGGERGVFLPAPEQLASVWRTLDPDTKRLAISAYGLAGVSEERLLRRVSFFSPTGTGSAARTAVFG